MAKALSQLRSDLANRLGYYAQGGAEIIQGPMLDLILQQAQAAVLSEFGDMLPGTTYPPTMFVADADISSVPDEPLMYRALFIAKGHYRQPDSELAAANWANYERNARGLP